eukprot:1267478-Rhodomonas_salina.2
MMTHTASQTRTRTFAHEGSSVDEQNREDRKDQQHQRLQTPRIQGQLNLKFEARTSHAASWIRCEHAKTTMRATRQPRSTRNVTRGTTNLQRQSASTTAFRVQQQPESGLQTRIDANCGTAWASVCTNRRQCHHPMIKGSATCIDGRVVAAKTCVASTVGRRTRHGRQHHQEEERHDFETSSAASLSSKELG